MGPSQRPLPDNTQHSQETNIYAPGGIRARNPSKRVAADRSRRPRSQRDRPDLESSDINPLSVHRRRLPAAPDTRPHLITYRNGADQDPADFQLTKPLNHMLQCSIPCRMGGFPLTRMKVGYYCCLTGSFTCYHQEIMAEGEKG